MSPTAVPTRITIDFRDAVHPSRTWILGLDAERQGRVELIAFDGRTPRIDPLRAVPATPMIVQPAAIWVDCACPDFCERDHANE